MEIKKCISCNKFTINNEFCSDCKKSLIVEITSISLVERCEIIGQYKFPDKKNDICPRCEEQEAKESWLCPKCSNATHSIHEGSRSLCLEAIIDKIKVIHIDKG